MGKTKTPEVLYVVMRYVNYDPTDDSWDDRVPVAIHEYMEDADSMCGKYNQEMKDRGIGTINFSIMAVPAYD